MLVVQLFWNKLLNCHSNVTALEFNQFAICSLKKYEVTDNAEYVHGMIGKLVKTGTYNTIWDAVFYS